MKASEMIVVAICIVGMFLGFLVLGNKYDEKVTGLEKKVAELQKNADEMKTHQEHHWKLFSYQMILEERGAELSEKKQELVQAKYEDEKVPLKGEIALIQREMDWYIKEIENLKAQGDPKTAETPTGH